MELSGDTGFWFAVACWGGWCLAIWPKTTTLRRGLSKGVQFLVVSMFRYRRWWCYLASMAAGWTGIYVIWKQGGEHWVAMLSSLAGVAFGGSMIWVVRIVGLLALKKEAMGFGDVTLLAMIGAYLGWQATLVIFFVAPFTAIFLIVAQWVLTKRRETPYGPYLCVGSLIAMFGWSRWIWPQTELTFRLGAWIPAFLFFAFLAMGGLLRLWKIAEEAMHGAQEKS